MVLEIELETHLDLTRRIRLAGYLPETTGVEGTLDTAKLRVVEGVKGFHSELELGAFTHFVQGDVLEQGHRGVAGSRHA